MSSESALIKPWVCDVSSPIYAVTGNINTFYTKISEMAWEILEFDLSECVLAF